MFQVAGSPPLLANVIQEEEEYIAVEHPLVILKESPNVYTFQYMPFAKNGLVLFKSTNIISVASVDDEMIKYYNDMVDVYRNQKTVYKTESEEPQTQIVPKRYKVLH